MGAAFRAGTADFVHLQGPVVTGEILASVGASMPPVAFSSLCCAREYQKTGTYRAFLKTYRTAREWVQSAPAEEVARKEAGFFPLVPAGLLQDAVHRYQALSCWEGSIEIARDLYEQALTVFQSAGEIGWRHGYDEVVG